MELQHLRRGFLNCSVPLAACKESGGSSGTRPWSLRARCGATAAASSGSNACSWGCSSARSAGTTGQAKSCPRLRQSMPPGMAASRPCTASPRLGRGKQQQAKQVQRHLESAKLLQRMRQVLSQCTVLCRSVGPWHSCDPSGRAGRRGRVLHVLLQPCTPLQSGRLEARMLRRCGSDRGLPETHSGGHND